jgi:hypothetical protein
VGGVQHLAADALDDKSLGTALNGLKPTHIWSSDLDPAADGEAEYRDKRRHRAARARSCGAGEERETRLPDHRLTHYLGPFEFYARTGTLPMTPVREEHPRLPMPNFYYSQEDELYTAAERHGFTWSVHRPHTMIGKAIGNAMNMGTTLAAFASLCKETGRSSDFLAAPPSGTG